MKPYGIELILDIHKCSTPFTRTTIKKFMVDLCNAIGMERGPLHFWGYDDEKEKEEAPDHLAGTSAIQFIYTSNVTIHTLDKQQAVRLNIFTCSDLDQEKTTRFCAYFWAGQIVNSLLVERL